MKFLSGATLALAALVATPSVYAQESRGVAGHVEFSDLVVPVLDDFRMHGVLSTSFSVKIPDERQRKRVQNDRPKAVDTYMRHLTEFARLWVDPSRPVDVPRLLNALEKATEELALGEGINVYITETTVRRR